MMISNSLKAISLSLIFSAQLKATDIINLDVLSPERVKARCQWDTRNTTAHLFVDYSIDVEKASQKNQQLIQILDSELAVDGTAYYCNYTLVEMNRAFIAATKAQKKVSIWKDSEMGLPTFGIYSDANLSRLEAGLEFETSEYEAEKIVIKEMKEAAQYGLIDIGGVMVLYKVGDQLIPIAFQETSSTIALRWKHSEVFNELLKQKQNALDAAKVDGKQTAYLQVNIKKVGNKYWYQDRQIELKPFLK